MKTVILAGGFGTRISEESHLKPKPMIEIGQNPLIWHIMKYYSYYGFNDFIICTGYRGYVIKEYFADYYMHMSDVTFNMKENSVAYHGTKSEPWKVTVVNTGLDTMTGGRIKRIKPFVGNERFMLTYGDGVSDINLHALAAFHKEQKSIGTLSAIRTVSRFGVLDINDRKTVTRFAEKDSSDGDLVNGGFMVLEPEIFDYIEGDRTVFEKDPLERLTKEGNLSAFRHEGFWQCMDTLRDKEMLEKLVAENKAPWMVWKSTIQ